MTFGFSRPLSLRLPTQISFGNGCAQTTAVDLLRRSSSRILVCTSPSVRAHAEGFVQIFRAADRTVTIFDDILPEPTAGLCESLRAQARAFAPDLVVAIGGGSVLDIAKLIAATHQLAEPIDAFYGQGLLPPRHTTGLVCVPTTAGTGSEVSPNALLFDEPTSSKKAVISPSLVPDFAIVDPGLMTGLPPFLTATTGIDALTHCLEAYANKDAHPLVDPYALEGVRLIGQFLPRAVANGHDLEARSAIALGSLYGGLCLGPVNTAGVHALAYPLGGEFHLAHGLSIALLLPHVVRFNCSEMSARHAALARALGPGALESSPQTASPNDDTATAPVLAQRIEQLISATGIRAGLRHHGIPRDAIPRMAEGALQVTRLLKNNPREITREDALLIYEAAY